VVVVVLLGHGLGPGGSAGVKIVATAIAAFAFEPVRERLARFANRLVYGNRATPYEMMADFSDRLGDAISVDDVLPRGGARTAVWPDGASVQSYSQIKSVRYRGADVGEIAVATPHGERLRAS